MPIATHEVDEAHETAFPFMIGRELDAGLRPVVGRVEAAKPAALAGGALTTIPAIPKSMPVIPVTSAQSVPNTATLRRNPK